MMHGIKNVNVDKRPKLKLSVLMTKKGKKMKLCGNPWKHIHACWRMTRTKLSKSFFFPSSLRPGAVDRSRSTCGIMPVGPSKGISWASN
jgi:hypothetical protein